MRIALFLLAFAAFAKPPNIVLIFADDMPYSCLGERTPAINRVFEEGVSFANGYATHAVCAPSRAGLMTGRYQARFGLETLPGDSSVRKKTGYGLDTNEILMPALLQEAGYATCAIGKWHLGMEEKFQPNARGFDHWFGYRGSCGFYQFASEAKAIKKGQEITPEPNEVPRLDVVRNGESLEVRGYLTDHFADEAVDWIGKQDKPYFLYFAPYNVHGAYLSPPKYGTGFDGCLRGFDAAVARILEVVDDNTLVVFANDNGGTKDQGNAPFRGNKATYYEGGVRVPFAMRWPAKIAKGSRFDGMVSTLDLLPTFVGLAGGKLPNDRVYDGHDLMPFLDGKRPAAELRETHFWRSGTAAAVRRDDWKLVWPVDRPKHKKLLAELGITHFKGRATTDPERDKSLFLAPELYNLGSEQAEAKNVAEAHPEKVRELTAAIADWEAEMPKTPAKSADDRPNIILVMTDDMGAECLGAYGARDYKTPVLDALAKTGLRFDRCYSTPICTPSRVQLMTGRYTHRNYIGFGKFPPGETTFGNTLQDAGYATCMVGKWQLGGDHQTPHTLGFDEYCLQNGILPAEPFDRSTRGRERFWGYPVIVANSKLYESKARYGPDMLNEYARDFIRRKKDGPFFLYYPMILTHSPFAPTPLSKDGDKSGAKISELKYFKDMVEYSDHLVGRLLETLDEEGIRDNTLVIFTGDNGTTYPVRVTAPAPKGLPKVAGIQGARHRSQLPAESAAKPRPDYEGPLTRTNRGDVPGGKDLMNHRGIHVPLIVDWPRYRAEFAKHGNVNDGLVDFTDFHRSFAEIAKGKLPTDRRMDGSSLAAAFRGKTADSARDWAFCHYWEFGRKKDNARDAIWDKRYKLYDNGDLFDLSADLEEIQPLKTLSPEAQTAKRKLQAALTDVKQEKVPKAPPNVVLIFADDMGWGDVGYHGYTDVRTPHIDRIAREGVQFSQGYVSASVCGPSRAGLMTGVYQQRVGAGENASATGFPNMPERFRMSGLPTSQSTIAEILRPQGYRCGMVGKWHLGVDVPLRPQNRGFNFFWGFLNGSHSYTEWEPKFAPRKDKWPIFRNNEMLPAQSDIYLTDLFSDRAVNFIRHKPDKPFFLYLAYNAVHHPWQVPDKYLARTKDLPGGEDRRFFAAMVMAMDDGIGRVLETLDDEGIADNTLVIFLSDNGTPRGQGLVHKTKDNSRPRGGTVMSNAGPHRGFKGDTYEGGTKVPFTMRWPAKIAAGSRYDLPVSALDIAPTIAARLGIEKPLQGHPFDGVDLLPFLSGDKGDSRPHDTLYWRRDNDYAIRQGDWKLTWNDASGSMSIKLFNLADDPGEHHDLAAQNPERAQALQDAFDAWDSQLPDNRSWGGPGNRAYATGQRVKVADYNTNPPKRPPAKVH